MKRLVALLIAFVLLTASCASLAAERSPFDPGLSNAIIEGVTDPQEWYDNMNNLIVVVLAVDIMLHDQELAVDFDVAQPSFTGLAGDELVFFFNGDTHDYCVRYQPAAGTAEYTMLDNVSTEELEAQIKAVCGDAYKLNDIEEMNLYANIIFEALSSAE